MPSIAASCFSLVLIRFGRSRAVVGISLDRAALAACAGGARRRSRRAGRGIGTVGPYVPRRSRVGAALPGASRRDPQPPCRRRLDQPSDGGTRRAKQNSSSTPAARRRAGGQGSGASCRHSARPGKGNAAGRLSSTYNLQRDQRGLLPCHNANYSARRDLSRSRQVVGWRCF